MAFEGLTEKLSNAFKKLRGKGRLSEADVKDAMREIRLALLEADVSYKVVKDFIKKTTERAVGTDVLESLTPAQMIVKIVNEELTALMGSENQKIHMASQPPTVVMLVGLQGAGKTTNGAKLAGLFKKQNKNPLLVACDIYRPAAIKQLQQVLVDKASDNVETIMPGYTHMQHAQPISYGHYLMAYFQMLQRDAERFQFNMQHTDVSPLGAAALAGTTFPIDRQLSAKYLGFSDIYHNSLDAVSDRDFVLEFLSSASILMMHLSRMCEELIYWCSYEFGYIELSDAYSTGSSIMPQKKNPDTAELIRGKTGRVYGDLMGLLTTMKGLPLAYNKDMQEDKEGVFDAVKTIIPSLKIMAGMVETLKVNQDKMEHAVHNDFSNATELADYLASKGIPFRQAHEIVGELVLKGLKTGKNLSDISLAEYQKISPLITEDVYHVLQPRVAVERRNSAGGTGFAQVEAQIKAAKELLKD